MYTAYESGVVPARLNPDLDPETAQEVAFFKRHGYLVIDQAIDGDQLALLRQLFDQHIIPSGEWLVPCGLMDIDARFADLIDNPPVLRRIRALLGTCIQLHSIAAIIKPPGGPVQRWHRDGPWPMEPAGTPVSGIPGQINCGYYLQELTDEIGPVWVVPGSQRAPFRPPTDPIELPDGKPVYMKPGQALLFDGWLWHRGGANRSADQIRMNCMYCYQNAWCKSREDMRSAAIQAIREAGSAARKLLLGGANVW